MESSSGDLHGLERRSVRQAAAELNELIRSSGEGAPVRPRPLGFSAASNLMVTLQAAASAPATTSPDKLARSLSSQLPRATVPSYVSGTRASQELPSLPRQPTVGRGAPSRSMSLPAPAAQGNGRPVNSLPLGQPSTGPSAAARLDMLLSTRAPVSQLATPKTPATPAHSPAGNPGLPARTTSGTQVQGRNLASSSAAASPVSLCEPQHAKQALEAGGAPSANSARSAGRPVASSSTAEAAPAVPAVSSKRPHAAAGPSPRRGLYTSAAEGRTRDEIAAARASETGKLSRPHGDPPGSQEGSIKSPAGSSSKPAGSQAATTQLPKAEVPAVDGSMDRRGDESADAQAAGTSHLESTQPVADTAAISGISKRARAISRGGQTAAAETSATLQGAAPALDVSSHGPDSPESSGFPSADGSRPLEERPAAEQDSARRMRAVADVPISMGTSSTRELSAPSIPERARDAAASRVDSLTAITSAVTDTELGKSSNGPHAEEGSLAEGMAEASTAGPDERAIVPEPDWMAAKSSAQPWRVSLDAKGIPAAKPSVRQLTASSAVSSTGANTGAAFTSDGQAITHPPNHSLPRGSPSQLDASTATPGLSQEQSAGLISPDVFPEGVAAGLNGCQADDRPFEGDVVIGEDSGFSFSRTPSATGSESPVSPQLWAAPPPVYPFTLPRPAMLRSSRVIEADVDSRERELHKPARWKSRKTPRWLGVMGGGAMLLAALSLRILKIRK